MFKYLELLGNAEEMKELFLGLDYCLNKNLIKYAVNKSSFEYLVLEENLEEVKSILKDNYSKFDEYDILQWIEQILVVQSYSIEVENYEGDSVEVKGEDMFEIISDELDIYIDDYKKLQIYESDNPEQKLEELLNICGRNEIENRLNSLQENLSRARFR